MHAKPSICEQTCAEPVGAGSTTLDQLRPGDLAKTVRVRPAPETAQRLQELGFVPGTVVRLVRHAPFGDPLEVELCGYHLSLRKAEAGLVEVERLEPLPGICARG